MIDPRKYVRPGQPLALAAQQINFLNALMANGGLPAAGALDGWNFGGNVIVAMNATGAVVPRWGIMKITGVEIDPNAGAKQAAAFGDMPCVTCGSPDGDIASTFVVAVEPIKAGKLGRVAVAGVVQVTIASLNVIRAHVQVLWESVDWALVRIGSGAGGVRLGKINSTWGKGATKTVTRLRGDGSLFSPSMTFDAINYFSDIIVDCGERKVACASVDSTWILIAAEC